jgi:hypothetical protein
MDFIAQHVGAVLSVAVVASAAAGWLARHAGILAGVVEQEVEKLDEDVLGKVHSPVVKAFLVKVEAAADEAIPGSGDAKYAALTALIMHDLPPSAAPFEPALEAVLTAIGAGAKAGISKAVAPPVAP